jgi:hypothetical protein
VTDADFWCVERSRENVPKGGGGQTYFSLGRVVDREDFGAFLGIDPPSLILTERPRASLDARVLTDPSISEDLGFSPRYRKGPDRRYRIDNQNRQRANMVRHPAWRADRGFPVAPDDVASKTDPGMPDLSFLKLIVTRDVEGNYAADYVDAAAPPPGTPSILGPLFLSNGEVPAEGLIEIAEIELDESELAAIVMRSHAGAIDGKPTAPEIEDVRERTAEGAGRRRRSGGGQGFRQSSEERQALDRHAMGIATAHFEALGWSVTDKSINNPYDLSCKKGKTVLRVEVKGTTSDGRAVLLTPNEVTHAQEQYPHVALLVVHGIGLGVDADGKPVTSGGTVDLTMPWEIDADGTLAATGYTYERK